MSRRTERETRKMLSYVQLASSALTFYYLLSNKSEPKVKRFTGAVLGAVLAVNMLDEV